jgi:hypothetical protein
MMAGCDCRRNFQEFGLELLALPMATGFMV